MKIFDLGGRVHREGGETVLGLKDLGTHACYMLYGVLEPDGPPRTLRPGPGHEEIILAVTGALELTGPKGDLTLQPGQAVHLVGEDSLEAKAAGPLPSVYVAAGGHSQGHGHDEHHHH